MPTNIALKPFSANRLILVFIALLSISVQALAQSNPSVISVNGHGKVSAQPDQAQLTVHFTDTKLEADDARRLVDQQVRQALKEIKQYTIKENSLDSSQVRIHPQYDYHQNKSELKGYQVERSISLILSDLSQLEALVKTISEAKTARLQPIQFGLDNPSKAKNQALSKAIKQSKKTATKIANDYGVKLGKVHSVTYQSNANNRPVLRAMKMEMASADSGSTYQQQDLDFSAHIQVSFTFE